MVDAVVGAVVGNVVNKAFGGGGGGTTSRPTSTAPQPVPGSPFQPFTYRSTGGFGVTGAPSGSQYTWSADIPQWMTDLGAGGALASGDLFNRYYTTAAQDPYAVGEEYYRRALQALDPQFEAQNEALKSTLFGGGRLGQIVGGVNPDAYKQTKARQETLANVYANALTSGQTLQTNRLNQLSQAAEAAKNLSLLPMATEKDLINFAKNLEVARSDAPKTYTQQIQYGETPQSVFAGQIAPTIGSAVGNAAGNLFRGTPVGYTGNWTNPNSMSSSVSNFFGGLFS